MQSAVPWAVAVVFAEAHKQWPGPRTHLFYTQIALLAGLESRTHLSPCCAQMRYCPSEESGWEVSSRIQGSHQVSLRGDGPRLNNADTSGTWQDTPK